MKKGKSNARGNSGYRFLWLITGVLIGVFVCCLLFLKKQVTVVEEVSANHSTPPIATKIKVTQKTNAPDGSSNDQYDFYTMLPNMQVKSGQTTPPTAATVKPTAPSTTPATPVAAKPTKPLNVAEQSMLAPRMATAPSSTPSTVPATATPAPNTPATAMSTPTTVDTPSKFNVVAGNFADYQKADARKAELFLAGMDQTKIIKYSKNGMTGYLVVIGTFTDKTQAQKALQELQSHQFSGTIQPA